MAAVRTLIVLAVTAGLLVLSPGTSWACSCVSADPTEQVKRAETVVDGTLEWVTTNGLETTYSVNVDQVFKGKAAVHEKLVGPASGASCGLGSLATGKRYLFFIDGEHPGQMKVGLCGGSTLYDAKTLAAIEAVTGSPSGPVVTPPVVSAVDQGPIDGVHWYTVLAGALVIGLVLTGLLRLARRTR